MPNCPQKCRAWVEEAEEVAKFTPVTADDGFNCDCCGEKAAGNAWLGRTTKSWRHLCEKCLTVSSLDF